MRCLERGLDLIRARLARHRPVPGAYFDARILIVDRTYWYASAIEFSERRYTMHSIKNNTCFGVDNDGNFDYLIMEEFSF